jgi:hypothetical protein
MPVQAKKTAPAQGRAGTVAGAVCRGRPGTTHDVGLQSADAIKLCFKRPSATAPVWPP